MLGPEHDAYIPKRIWAIADAIEGAAFSNLGIAALWPGREYTRKVRALVLNLNKRRKNMLAQRVLFGGLSARELVALPSSEYAAPHIKAQRQDTRRQACRAAMRDPYANWNKSDTLYCCPRCSSNHTMYRIWKRVGCRYDRHVTQLRCTRCNHSWQRW